MKEKLHDTLALCPECLKTLKADVFADDDGAVWMTRTCAEHGQFDTRIWPDVDHYRWLTAQAMPKTPPQNTIACKAPCPFGCGTCARHERRGTLLEIEVTWQCNLRCPVCFMSADTEEHDPTLDEISAMYDVIADAVGTDGAVQLTGGEPTCRKDLPEIIRMGREKGFWGIELNTNGLVIASRPGYLESLKEAGVTGLFLSFDGLTGDVYEATCGRDILKTKLKCVERCREAGVQVVLCMTILAGLNDDQLGDVLRFALENSDIVAGLALQPAFTSGRFNARQATGMTATSGRSGAAIRCATRVSFSLKGLRLMELSSTKAVSGLRRSSSRLMSTTRHTALTARKDRSSTTSSRRRVSTSLTAFRLSSWITWTPTRWTFNACVNAR